ncbi:putative glycosyltransferase [Prochlorococcus sp. MIT 0702]|uniref:glycosyltransferase family 4 protein n=1 Tax=unclassified Prochlorococcus TaxID=2627481 RepID=UPI0005338F52|nr:putative glycosyltransferase [Prochlorococcus sp. MIT 0701]KGG27853.1 putative glycosyltransferase [Prochlorococcus sp. MIT 0702]KGG31424.1 putative glycosyltransferase [Prochlorococcus sp. MIT 0703]
MFVHQSFPGQYLHLVNALAKQSEHKIVALTINPPSDCLPPGLQLVRYSLGRGNSADVHPLAMETESKVIRGEACARAAHSLKEQGFMPDLICAHPGWGESLFLSDIWPQVPILSYQEFYYKAEGSDSDFDPEFQSDAPWEIRAKVRMKNAYLQLALESSTWNVTPTAFQRSSFPVQWQQKISTIHDGIRTDLAYPNKNVAPIQLSEGRQINPTDQLITFVNRTLEPYRGCHTFIRAIPRIQQLCPHAKILIVGQTSGVSYGKVCPGGEWKDQFLAEIDGQYDPDLVLFSGSMVYEKFLRVLQLSKVHVYLTYPFVLSWSLLEAMSSGCAVVASDTLPVREVIQHGVNGLLVDFFSPNDVADYVSDLIHDRALAVQLGLAARHLVLDRYSLEKCLPRHLSLLQLVGTGSLF